MRFESIDQLEEAMEIGFSAEQREAIAAPMAPGVIIAGAGTGKTTVMAARVVWLVGTGRVRPEQVLGLTFTTKAAGELGERIRRALTSSGVAVEGTDAGTELVATYDSFAATVVREFGLRLGLEGDQRLIEKATAYRLADRVVRRAAEPLPRLGRLSHATIPGRLLDLDGELQSHLVTTARAADFTRRAAASFLSAPVQPRKPHAPYKDMLSAAEASEERLELLRLVERYQALKEELQVMEFADQLRTAWRLAREVPGIGRELRERFKVVLLDEYQDTSSAQTGFLSLLFRDHPVTAVGDPYQAIYGWRGAASDNIHQFEREFGEVRRFALSINRRSRSAILDVGNRLASTIPGEGVELRAPEGTEEGVVEARACTTEPDETRFVAQRVIELGGPGRWGEIAVLCRNNAMVTEFFEALRDVGVPVEIVGLGGLLHLPEVVPVVAALRLLADPTDNPAAATLLTSPAVGLGLRDMEELGRRARQLQGEASPEAGGLGEALTDLLSAGDPVSTACLMDACLDPPRTLSAEGRTRVARLVRDLAWLRGYRGEPVADLVARIIRLLRVEEELRARDLGVQQLERFVDACAEFQPVDGDAGLTGLVAYLDAEIAHDEGMEQAIVSEDDSVKLMTAHRSKGLEWDTVFLPGLMQGTFPSTNRSGAWPTKAELLPAPLRGDAESVPQLAEYSNQDLKAYKAELAEAHGHAEDRLAYVAATRARRHLVGSCHAWAPGLKRPKAPSRYFQEIRQRAAELSLAVDDVEQHDENPLPESETTAAWPAVVDAQERERWEEAAQLVRESAGQGEEWAISSGTLTPEDADRLRVWDEAAAHLRALRERATSREVRLPTGLSATALQALREDPDAFAEQLVRPMPRKPSEQARLGTRFHDWVQRRFELPGVFDEFEHQDDAELARLIAAFERGRFANRTPIAVEVPFAMAWGSAQLRGRIDAVYRFEGPEFDEIVIDWKTSNAPANELQLAVYRQAWAEARGLDPERVGAAFYHVEIDRLVMAGADRSLIDEAWPWH